MKKKALQKYQKEKEHEQKHGVLMTNSDRRLMEGIFVNEFKKKEEQKRREKKKKFVIKSNSNTGVFVLPKSV